MNKFFMICGLPGSGKSTYAKEISSTYNAIVHSSDALRGELFGDENANDKNSDLFQELHKRIKTDLSSGKNVIYDATNINYKRRKAFVGETKKYNCEKICCLIATPYEQCLIQNKNRERQVPDDVIKKMYMSFYIPQKYEGWDSIRISWNEGSQSWSLYDLFEKLNSFEQDNPYHTLKLGEHLRKCYIETDHHELEVNVAAMLHDIGKPFTKTFQKMNGEVSDVAHYYQHHLVGAYDAMFYLKAKRLETDEIVRICNYIQWHMQPYFIETDKAKNKFIRLVGEDFYNKLMILHEADKKAH